MNAKRKGTRRKLEQMAQDTPKKTMTEAQYQALVRQYRIEALKLIGPALQVLERWAYSQPTCNEDLLLYRQQLAKTRIVVEEVQNVMDRYRGKVSPEELESLIEDARRRGHRKARMVPDRGESK